MENSIDHIITRILSGNSSSEDFLSLSEWLNADEKNKKEFRLLKSYWDAEVSFSHSLMPNVSLDNLRKKIDDQSRQKRLRLIRFIATPIAAAIAFLVLFFATTHLNTREGKVQQFYTYITDKNKSHFTLDDGTKIILNRNSRLPTLTHTVRISERLIWKEKPISRWRKIRKDLSSSIWEMPPYGY